MSHLLSAFIERPNQILFESQQEGEEIILVLRAAPIITLRWIVMGIFLALIPFLIPPLLPVLNLPASPTSLARGLLIFTLVWELVAIGYVFEQFLHYFFSVYIITNRRVLDFNFKNIVQKSVSDAQLQDIEDVTYTQNGIFRSIFNYGDVFIQTAGIVQDIEFLAVPRPDEVAQVLAELQPIGGDEG